jgi:hypothetical protein
MTALLHRLSWLSRAPARRLSRLALGAERVSLSVALAQLSFAFGLLSLLYPLLAQESLYAQEGGAYVLWGALLIAHIMCLLNEHGLLAQLIYPWALILSVTFGVFEALQGEPLSPSTALTCLIFITLGARLNELARGLTRPQGGAPRLTQGADHLSLPAWGRRAWGELSGASRALLLAPCAALLCAFALTLHTSTADTLDARLTLPYIFTLSSITALILWGVSRGRRARAHTPPHSDLT